MAYLWVQISQPPILLIINDCDLNKIYTNGGKTYILKWDAIADIPSF